MKALNVVAVALAVWLMAGAVEHLTDAASVAVNASYVMEARQRTPTPTPTAVGPALRVVGARQ